MRPFLWPENADFPKSFRKVLAVFRNRYLKTTQAPHMAQTFFNVWGINE